MNKLQKAAMFGLDARIALAIFGALSVITGASLFSAIKEAKTVAFATYLDEVVKASEAYLLDTGTNLPQTSSRTANIGALVSDIYSVNNWRGPYTAATISGNVYSKESKGITAAVYMAVYLQKSSTWATNAVTSSNQCGLSSANCSEYISFIPRYNNTTDRDAINELFRRLDERVDSSDGALSGKIRIYQSPTPILMYQGMPRKRTS